MWEERLQTCDDLYHVAAGPPSSKKRGESY